MTKLLSAICLSALLTVPAVAQTYIGYTNTDYVRTGGVRFGTSQTQGQAIKLPKEKLDLLRGKSITGVRTVFGTSHMEELTFFVTTDLNATPLYTQSASDGRATWRDFNFDTPFVIGDEDSLYVGYTLTASTAYRPLQFDNSMGLRDRSFYYTPSGWTDAFDQGIGCACMQLIVDAASFTDVIVKDFSANGYYLAGHAYTYSCQLLNFGTETISNCTITYQIGSDEAQTMDVAGLNLASNSTSNIDLPLYTSTETGNLPISIRVENINGQDADADDSDNATLANIYMYPADMKRAVLLEGFTGQACSNCPSGHQSINTALQQYDGDVIEVFHHIGYQPDNFTMSEESYYINFYGSNSTYAPAFMVNRMPSESSSVPVQNVSTGAVLNMFNYCAAIQPYVGVEINSTYDEATRTVTGTVDIYTHVVPDADTTLLSLLVVQDSIVANQLGGNSNYVHRYAYRGSLIGQYGGMVHLEQGSYISVPFEYTLPEAIVSTYYASAYDEDQLPSLPTDPAHMYLVAAVGKYSTAGDVVENPIYNATMVKMCAANVSQGIDNVSEAQPSLTVSGGRLVLSEPCDRVSVYDMTGRSVTSIGANATEVALPKGLYVVRVSKGDTSFAKKVAVQ